MSIALHDLIYCFFKSVDDHTCQESPAWMNGFAERCFGFENGRGLRNPLTVLKNDFANVGVQK